MKLDIKSAVFGVLCGLTLTFAFGYTGTTGGGQFISNDITWAMVVPPDGKVLARAYDGGAFVIDIASSKAKRVEHDPRKIDVICEQVILSGKD